MASGNPDWKVLVLPGLMGSTLSKALGKGDTVWMDPLMVCSNGPLDELLLSPDGTQDQDSTLLLGPSGIAPLLYDPLIAALTFTGLAAVETYPYDWRKPIADSAARLAEYVKGFLSPSKSRRVVFVAHSMGGLVVSNALPRLGFLASQVAGIVGFGVPWLGSYEAALNLLGTGTYVRLFAELTLRQMKPITDVIQTFWGLTDLLPCDPTVLDVTLYQNGPLGRSPCAEVRLAEPVGLARAPGLPLLAVVGRSRQTAENIVRSGVTVTPVMGPGDGIVAFASSTAGTTFAPVLVDENHIMLPIDPIGIVETVRQVGSWLTNAPYGIPSGMPLVSPHQNLLAGFKDRLEAWLTRSPVPASAWGAILHHW
jgi:pimeloyl-ACP methyl ester carboxylesterase